MNLDTTLLKIDTLLKQSIALVWRSLPEPERTAEELHNEMLRLTMRALGNFTDDLNAFEARHGGPGNAGKPWNSADDEELSALFGSGNTIADLATYFQRTHNGIRARLVRLGLVDGDLTKAAFITKAA
ncbi:MAG: hypothetical protein ABI182_01325 [Candidatus Baltobacteraceae bacterium]